jgi:hypothetical protein
MSTSQTSGKGFTMISDTSDPGEHQALPYGGPSVKDEAAFGPADWLSLAAAPTFAVMAVVSGHHQGDPADVLCLASAASPLSGMAVMYGLMSAFHLAPWLKLIAARRQGIPQR